MLPTHKRSLGYVFQEASLFQHLRAPQPALGKVSARRG